MAEPDGVRAVVVGEDDAAVGAEGDVVGCGDVGGVVEGVQMLEGGGIRGGEVEGFDGGVRAGKRLILWQLCGEVEGGLGIDEIQVDGSIWEGTSSHANKIELGVTEDIGVVSEIENSVVEGIRILRMGLVKGHGNYVITLRAALGSKVLDIGVPCFAAECVGAGQENLTGVSIDPSVLTGGNIMICYPSTGVGKVR